jgi:hypothetical protein
MGHAQQMATVTIVQCRPLPSGQCWLGSSVVGVVVLLFGAVGLKQGWRWEVNLSLPAYILHILPFSFCVVPALPAALVMGNSEELRMGAGSETFSNGRGQY